MTQLCVLSTLSAAASVIAAIDTGAVPSATESERVLIVTNNAEAPELVTPWHETPGAGAILGRFDRVIYLNGELHPYHPGAWAPPDDDLPLLEKLFRSHWDLGDGAIELVLDSVDNPPAATLARIFRGGPITVVADGLMGYGPAPVRLPVHVVQLLDGLIYLDLLPGLSPLLLEEWGTRTEPISAEEFKGVVGRMVCAAREQPGTPPDYGDMPTSLILGQGLAAPERLSEEEEEQLLAAMVDAAAGQGARRVALRPHPRDSLPLIDRVRREAQARGVEFELLDSEAWPEMIAATTALHSVVSCFDSALVTLNVLYGVPAISIGCELLLKKTAPYQDPSRIPATVVDARTRPEEYYRDPEQLRRLVQTVAYCMQSQALPQLRDVAEALLAEMSYSEQMRYVKKKRLTALKLPVAEPTLSEELDGARKRGVAGSVRGLLRKATRRSPDS